MAIQALDMLPGDRVLEVGVGTGLSLPLYPRHVNVTAIDLSEDMIAKTKQCVSRKGLSNVQAVLEMDAERMTFLTIISIRLLRCMLYRWLRARCV